MLQQALLPGKPFVGEGYRVAATYLPASAETEVGGDFYDVFKTETGR
jgi:serine phosphatase RsbU (regulator of sigma subunit)